MAKQHHNKTIVKHKEVFRDRKAAKYFTVIESSKHPGPRKNLSKKKNKDYYWLVDSTDQLLTPTVRVFVPLKHSISSFELCSMVNGYFWKFNYK